MKVAVTGATGHIGTNLCRMLVQRGYEVKALIHNDRRGLEDLPLEFIYGDIKNISDLSELCIDCEVVFNLAACVTIRMRDHSCEETNTASCRNIVSAAENTGVRRIIHFSSIHAFSQLPLTGVLDEERALAVDSRVSYDRSKAIGQEIMTCASGKNTEVIIMNPTSVIGPYDFKPSLIGNAIIRLYKGDIPGLIPGGYNWVDVRDVCAAAINAVENGIPGQCYILGGEWHDLRSLSKETENNGGHKSPALYLPFWMARAGSGLLNIHARITDSVPLYTSVSLRTLKNSHKNISSHKAASQIGFSSRPFEETISDTVKWFRDNKYIQ